MTVTDLLTRAFDEAVREQVKEQLSQIIDVIMERLITDHSITMAIDDIKSIKEKLKLK